MDDSAGYRVAIDTGDDGLFATDLSAAVIALSWRLGMGAPGDRLAAPARAHVSLRNEMRHHSPEASPLPTLPGLGLRIRYVDDTGKATTLFQGQLARAEPQTGSQGPRRATLYAEDWQQQLRENDTQLPTRESARADEIIADILDALPIRRRELAGRAILGLAEHDALGETTHLFSGETVPRILERGRSRFTLVTERWLSGISAWEAIRRIVESERGRFYCDRLGRAVFLQRHHLLKSAEPAAHFFENADALEYGHGDGICNEWRVRLQPRRRGPAGTTLWQLRSPFHLEAGASIVLRAHFRDALGRKVGALRIEDPIAGEDYRAYRDAAGAGREETAAIHLRLRERAADSALVSAQNLARYPLFLAAGLRLRGTPIWEDAPLTVAASDGRSIAHYGRRPRELPLLALNDPETAFQLACFELAQTAAARGNMRSITLAQRAHLPQILARSLFDRIQITDEQTGHSAPYFIVAEEHEVTYGGQRHECRWLLEAANTAHFATFGRSRFSEKPLLAY